MSAKFLFKLYFQQTQRSNEISNSIAIKTLNILGTNFRIFNEIQELSRTEVDALYGNNDSNWSQKF